MEARTTPRVGDLVRLRKEFYDTSLPLRGRIIKVADGTIWMKQRDSYGADVFSENKFSEWYELENEQGGSEY